MVVSERWLDNRTRRRKLVRLLRRSIRGASVEALWREVWTLGSVPILQLFHGTALRSDGVVALRVFVEHYTFAPWFPSPTPGDLRGAF